jgi:formylglycine-generating enzyme required for sulfatase activity
MRKTILFFSLLALLSCSGGPKTSIDNLKPFESDGFYTVPVKDQTLKLRKVSPDFFMMGETFDQGIVKNPEIRAVVLDGYAIGTAEVSAALWAAVMGGDTSAKGIMAGISWDMAQKFVTKLSGLTGIPFRLPTEAEWEYAAKDGVKNKNYCFAGWDSTREVVQCSTPDKKTCPVAGLYPNILGIYDMSGNAWEWVQDRPGPYSSEDQVNPVGPSEARNGADLRGIRGGSASSSWTACRVSNRGENFAHQFKGTIGFRLAL